jgi:hypothetical protein
MHIRRESLEARIAKIKEEIAALGDLHPGAVSQQFNICGNPRCRCKTDPAARHGPYYQLSYAWRRKSTTRFVRKEDLTEVRQQVRNYHRLRQLIDRWVTLAIALSRLRLKEEPRQSRAAGKRGSKLRISKENSDSGKNSAFTPTP